MEHRYDPTRSMRWYKALKVLLIIHILFYFAEFGYFLYLFEMDLTFVFDFGFALFPLLQLGSALIDILLFISLIRYSVRAPDLCIIMLAFNVIICPLLFVTLEFQLADVLIRYLAGLFIFYLPTYFYLRKRLVKKYWADQSSLTDQSIQESASVDSKQALASNSEETASSDSTHFV